MKALRFHHKGSLDQLHWEEMDQPRPARDEVLVQVKAAAINPSDLKNVLGNMHQTTLPRVPGRDFAGIVAEGPPEWLGREVFGTGDGLGFTRDGSHAEYLAIPARALVAKPEKFSMEQAAAFGVSYLTAWSALVVAANVREGQTVLITGVTGSVGAAAARIAHWRGAKVIGTVRKTGDLENLKGLPVATPIALESSDLVEAVHAATEGRGVDIALDAVGGPLFAQCLNCVAQRGWQLAIASTEPMVSFNLIDFYHRETRLRGVDTLKMSFGECADTLRELLPGIESGDFVPPEVEVYPLREGREGYERVSGGAGGRKIVLGM